MAPKYRSATTGMACLPAARSGHVGAPLGIGHPWAGGGLLVVTHAGQVGELVRPACIGVSHVFMGSDWCRPEGELHQHGCLGRCCPRQPHNVVQFKAKPVKRSQTCKSDGKPKPVIRWELWSNTSKTSDNTKTQANCTRLFGSKKTVMSLYDFSYLLLSRDHISVLRKSN